MVDKIVQFYVISVLLYVLNIQLDSVVPSDGDVFNMQKEVGDLKDTIRVSI